MGRDAKLPGQLIYRKVGVQIGPALSHVRFEALEQRRINFASPGAGRLFAVFRKPGLFRTQSREDIRLTQGMDQQVVNEETSGNGANGGYRLRVDDIGKYVRRHAVKKADGQTTAYRVNSMRNQVSCLCSRLEKSWRTLVPKRLMERMVAHR